MSLGKDGRQNLPLDTNVNRSYHKHKTNCQMLTSLMVDSDHASSALKTEVTGE